MKKICILLFCIFSFIISYSQAWTPLLGGSLNGQPYTMISFGGYSWFSGSFSLAGPVSATSIVRHDGTNWVPTPAIAGQVKTFCVWNNVLYGAGSFPFNGNTYGAVKWNGTGWDYFGLITSESFSTLTVFNNELVFGGRAPSVDGIPISHLVKWNGTTWSAFPFTITCSWLTLANIRVVKTIGSYLHVGGDFNYVNSTPSGLAFKTDGTSIIPMNLDWNYYVADFIKYHDSTFCTGNFPFGPFPANEGSPGIVKTENIIWRQVDHGLKMRGVSLSVALSNLYVGGTYNNTCYNVPCNHADVGNLGKWNGAAWSNESTGLFNQGNEVINFLYTDTINNVLYALGDFHTNRGDIADWVVKKQFSIVPVKLSLFTVSLEAGNMAKLRWYDETPADQNLFEVQMSLDGRNFSAVGSVKGKANVKEYSFSQPISGCGVRYFRLKFDGNTYSSIIPISIPCNVDIQGSKQSLRIQTKYPGTLEVINPQGQIVVRTVLTAGYTQVPVSVPPGLYIAKFMDKQDNSVIQKIIIQ